MTVAHMFEPLKIRSIEMRNRIAVSPMCQYSSIDGSPTSWHLVHLGSRAVGGAGMVIVEASAIEPRGRISPEDMGIWADKHVDAFRPIAQFIKEQGSVPAIQIAHAGRKASTSKPWEGGGPLEDQRKWKVVGPSPIPFADGWPVPEELTVEQIKQLSAAFVAAAKRSVEAGFEIIEIHSAHGYLLHSFLSPLSNQRSDSYGGSFENRTRFLRETTTAVRAAMPDSLPLFVRISCSDWVDGGWDIDQSVELSKQLKELGVDLIDCSSGGAVPYAKIEVAPGYQVPFAQRIRKEAGIASGAVGMITEARQANDIIVKGQADLVLLARQFLRDPYFPLHAAKELGINVPGPVQYGRAT